MLNNDNDWFRLKRYVHIGPQFNSFCKSRIKEYIENPDMIEKHSFIPFIHKEIKVRRFRKKVTHDGTRSILRAPTVKTRQIYYASHLDSLVYSYYSRIISKHYEKLLDGKEFNKCVTAYRQIKIDKKNNSSKNKSSVHFANDVFQYIKNYESRKDLVVIAFDIKSFFDNLDHKKLKQKWIEVLGFNKSLSPDHYNVFRNITKFSYVNEDELFKLFQNKIIVKKPLKGRKRGIKKEVRVDRQKYFKNKGAVSYCDVRYLREIREKGLIKSHKYIYCDKCKQVIGLRTKGIPQGSPISATLANIYMLDFDKAVNEIVTKKGGMYQRYSDDMVVICPKQDESYMINKFYQLIKENFLEIQESKTQVFYFTYDEKESRYFCVEKNINTKTESDKTSFEYLGFQFDGHYVLIKNSSMANHYRKMRKRFARSVFYAQHNKTNTKGEIFKSKLYKIYTYKGSHRKRSINGNRPSNKKKYYWGNFITYANLGIETITDNKIKGQIRNLWKNFHELMHNAEQSVK